jgi:hypothetical protein
LFTFFVFWVEFQRYCGGGGGGVSGGGVVGGGGVSGGGVCGGIGVGEQNEQIDIKKLNEHKTRDQN